MKGISKKPRLFILILTLTACFAFGAIITGSAEAASDVASKAKHKLADYAGWWYRAEGIEDAMMGYAIYIDAKSQTYSATDKYGNVIETQSAEYDSEYDKLFIERRYATEDTYLYFGEDGNTDVLYTEFYSWDTDESIEGVAYCRGKAPVAKKVSQDSVLGKWYMDGKAEGGKVQVLEFSKDRTYRFIDSKGKDSGSGSYKLKIMATDPYYGESSDYLSLDMGDEATYISNDGRLIAISYFFEDKYTAMGTPMYAGSYIYIHESDIGTSQAHDSIQNYKLLDYSWVDKDGGSLRFGTSDVAFYGQNERGYFREKEGTWKYEKGTLTITWTGKYTDRNLEPLKPTVKESCKVEDVEKGFTLPSLGKITKEIIDY